MKKTLDFNKKFMYYEVNVEKRGENKCKRNLLH